MTKEEFITTLRKSLTGKVPADVVNENISYYEEYIATGVRAGRSEEEVVNGLGDPRLLAKSIVETSGTSDNSNKDRIVGEGNAEEAFEDVKRKIGKLPSWAVTIIAIVLAVIVVSIVFAALRFLLPIVIVGAVAYAIYRYFKEKK